MDGNERYSYDALGNLTDKAGITMSYESGKPHAVTNLNGETTPRYSYDANGNMSSRNDGTRTWTLEWTPENMLQTATAGNDTITLTYDADGMMVQRSENYQTTTYPSALLRTSLGKLYEDDSVFGSKKYYQFNGKLVAMREGLDVSSPVSFFITDQLGSVSTTLWADGSMRSELRYNPWGEERYILNTTPTGSRYTAQRLDNTLGLYDYNARYYDPAIGRFITADTLIPKPQNPQSFNRFSYTYNNPTNYIDPSGHLTIEEMQDYFGYEDETAAIEGLGEELAGLLWNNEGVTWGDVIQYDGGNAMISLFELNNTTGNDTYRGGFWGLDGDNAGQEVLAYELKASDLITLNGDLAEEYRNGEGSLFVDQDSQYDYATTTIRLGIGELSRLIALLGASALVAGVLIFGAAFLTGGASIPISLSGVATALTTVGSIATIAGLLAEVLGNSNYPRFYPTIRYDNIYYGNKANYSIVIGAPGYN